MVILCVPLGVILGLIFARLLPLVFAIIVAVWLLHHVGWLIALALAAVAVELKT
jgi:hypothetical protein